MSRAAAILATPPRVLRSAYGTKDVILYALGLGLGSDPLDEPDLSFVYERHLRVLPTMAVIFARELDEFLAEAGIAFNEYLYAAQELRVHSALPTAGEVSAALRVTDLFGSGSREGAFLVLECDIRAASGPVRYATLSITLYCRDIVPGRTGAKQTGDSHPALRAPDVVAAVRTRADLPRLYRLSVGRNPLHVDPAAARAAGFDRPIMHGHCTLGLVCREVLRHFCADDPTRVTTLSARYSAAVYPGETLETFFWRDGRAIAFECRVPERGITVVKNGLCELLEN